ncbi:hypothetical protein PPERSA_02274 [Pseudocohnilembus persalinus]|uniref:JmjC domain-containing protein n=1 Tax=Pseudocohnilembus persalinus TaxID=266149 RepID=A0A0V0QLA7_PSEPJ|nr:hypothetical protein PPERSA_02274 [Pseudocohnilembus persalinus]|eukprot:KRX02784.1 hypothetical protein PPERSA_02274 [Pseudocohnilembus persalinus]
MLLDINQKEIYELFHQKGFRIPKFISQFFNNLHAINMWYSKKETSSNWHYDSHDNFLCILEGYKIVYILPPDNQILERPSILLQFYNQAKLKKQEYNEKNILNGIQDQIQENKDIQSEDGEKNTDNDNKNENENGININRNKQKQEQKQKQKQQQQKQQEQRSDQIDEEKLKIQKFILEKNSILYIPQGWYHKVVSKGEEIAAINFWFDSIDGKLKGREQYFLTYLLNKKMQDFQRDFKESNRVQLESNLGKIYGQEMEEIRKNLGDNYFVSNFLEERQFNCNLIEYFLSVASLENIIEFLKFVLVFKACEIEEEEEDEETENSGFELKSEKNLKNGQKSYLNSFLDNLSANSIEILTEVLEEQDKKFSLEELKLINMSGLDKVVKNKEIEKERFYKNFWAQCLQKSEIYQQNWMEQKEKIRSNLLQQYYNNFEKERENNI